MLVLAKDYELMKIFLTSRIDAQSQAAQVRQGQANVQKLDLQALDVHGRNACDLALELGNQHMLELLQRYGGYAQVQNLVKLKVQSNVKVRLGPTEAGGDADGLKAPVNEEAANLLTAI